MYLQYKLQVFTWNWGQSVGIPGPCEFFHQRKSSCSLMDIRVLWSSLYTAFTLTERERERKNLYDLLIMSNTETEIWPVQYNPSHTPLIVGDIQVSVDGQKSLFEEAYPLSLLLLRLVKDRLHFLHVAWSITRHFLKNLLIAGSHLQTGICSQLVRCVMCMCHFRLNWISNATSKQFLNCPSSYFSNNKNNG